MERGPWPGTPSPCRSSSKASVLSSSPANERAIVALTLPCQWRMVGRRSLGKCGIRSPISAFMRRITCTLLAPQKQISSKANRTRSSQAGKVSHGKRPRASHFPTLQRLRFSQRGLHGKSQDRRTVITACLNPSPENGQPSPHRTGVIVNLAAGPAPA